MPIMSTRQEALLVVWMLGAVVWILGAMVWILGAMVWMLGAVEGVEKFTKDIEEIHEAFKEHVSDHRASLERTIDDVATGKPPKARVPWLNVKVPRLNARVPWLNGALTLSSSPARNTLDLPAPGATCVAECTGVERGAFPPVINGSYTGPTRVLNCPTRVLNCPKQVLTGPKQTVADATWWGDQNNGALLDNRAALVCAGWSIGQHLRSLWFGGIGGRACVGLTLLTSAHGHFGSGGSGAVRAYPSEEGQEDIPETGTNRRRHKRMYPGRGQIRGGTRGYTRGGDQSKEGQEDMPKTGTNRRRDKRICDDAGETWLALQAKQRGMVDVLMTSDEYLRGRMDRYDVLLVLVRPPRPPPPLTSG
eukprot:1187825-Prorocentrum_minimum.AAC.1